MTRVALGDLVTVRGGGTPRKSVADYYGGGVPWVTPKDMKTRVISDSLVTLTQAGLASSPAKLIPENSVLVVVRSGVLKHTLPVGLTSVPVTVNQDMKALTPGPRLDASYLAHLLEARSAEVLTWVRATTADNFPIQNLLQLEVELPPIEEQRRIAAILDGADQTLSLARLHRCTVGQIPLQLLRRYAAEPHTRVGDIAVVTTGATPSRSVPQHFGGDIPWVKTTEVVGDDITFTSELVTREGMQAGRLRLYPQGSIVVAMYGQGATRGRVARLGVKATVNQACAVLQHTDEVNGDYLFWQLKASYERLRAAGRGGNQPNLNLELVRGFTVPMPPRDEQESFASAAGAVMTLENRSKKRLKLTAELVASLQSRAFSGEAVTHAG